MANGLEQQLAQAAATIADLRRQLGASQAATTVATQARDAAAAQRDQANASLADTQAALTVERQQHQSDLAAAAAALVIAKADVTAVQADYQKLTGKISAEQQSQVDQANARVAEITALCLSDPPPGSGIVKVTRYMTSDGTKHKTLPDAMISAKRLGLLAVGVRDDQVDALMAQGPKIADLLRS